MTTATEIKEHARYMKEIGVERWRVMGIMDSSISKYVPPGYALVAMEKDEAGQALSKLMHLIFDARTGQFDIFKNRRVGKVTPYSIRKAVREGYGDDQS